MKHSGFTLWQAIGLFALLVILAAILFPVFGRARHPRKGSCYSNLKQIALGINQYAMDYDEKYPLVLADDRGWATVIQPYVWSSWHMFHCPNVEPVSKDKAIDYFYNAHLSGVAQAAINSDIQKTIMNGDGLAHSRTDASLKGFSYGWRRNLDSPAFRHRFEGEGAIYVFLDGHTKWLKPQRISDGLPAKGSNQFSFMTE